MMQKLFRLGLILGLGVSFQACAVTMKMYANRFVSPEAQGEAGSGQVDPVGAIGSHELLLTPDTTASPPDLSSPSFRRDTSWYLGGAIGVADRIDIGVHNPFSSTRVLDAKWQFLGAPRAQAKKDNFSGAVSAGYFIGSSEGENEGLFTGVSSAKHRLEVETFDAALVLGYRPADFFLVYGGPFYSHYNFTLDIDQTKTSGSQLHFSLPGSGSQRGLNLGLRADSGKVHLTGEVAFAQAVAKGTQRNSAFLGVAFGMHW